MADGEIKNEDELPASYQPSELKIASEFLTTWLPFVSKDLCGSCSLRLSDRIRSIGTDGEEPSNKKLKTPEINSREEHDCDSKSVEGDDAETNSLGNWKDEANEKSETPPELGASPRSATPGSRMSWADMAQEDELEDEEEESGSTRHAVDIDSSSGKLMGSKVVEKPTLSREQRESIRFMNVGRKKDFICLERVKGKNVNILEGLELHTGVFSAAEQKRIVDYVLLLQEMGKKGELRERTFSAPRKWMKGKGRVTIQFGCCYNYATRECSRMITNNLRFWMQDKNGNPPGILRNENVDPIPNLFKVIIKRLVKWHVLPPSHVPDSCITNIYDEGDCIPPHIDSHDFVRPFCTVSFLSECDIIFGSNLEIVGPGEFSGPASIPLPTGSVLVLNGNGADVAKHCVPAVPSKRISITFRRMDESKRPTGFVQEQDLQGIQPLSYGPSRTNRFISPRSDNDVKRQTLGRVDDRNTRRYDGRSELRDSAQGRYRPVDRRRT